VLAQAVAERVFPGAVAAYGRAAGPVHFASAGRFTYAADSATVEIDTLFDWASLTKVVVTTTLLMRFVDEGRVDLAQPLRVLVPEFTGLGREEITLGHLLDHSSGLPAHLHLYRELQGREAFRRRLVTIPLEAAPGTRVLYSDLGFMLLGEALEALTGEALDTLAERHVLCPLQMNTTGYRPAASQRVHVAPSEYDPWRNRLLQGEVSDENAWALGGVAAHAGLFGPAGELARFARCLLAGGVLEGTRLVTGATLESFTRRTGRPPGSSRALGWDTPSGDASSSGTRMSARAFGHTGFVGSSLWIDPGLGLFVLLLAHCVHPSRPESRAPMRRVRRAVADAAVAQLSQAAGAS
jgi:CubicO group peptidase (beta-lactamase class C family)